MMAPCGQQRRGQAGNVTVLMLAFLIGCLFVTVLTLDLFVILYSRHAAQTAADTAALGALRAVQPAIADELWRRMTVKVERMFADAVVAHRELSQAWAAERAEAVAACAAGSVFLRIKEPYDPESGEEPEFEEVLDEVAYDACVDAWLSASPAPILAAVEEQFLAREIQDQAVVAVLMGRGGTESARQVINAVLDPVDKLCALRVVAADADAFNLIWGEADKYARANGGELADLEIPHEDRAQVFVLVEREIPTIFLQRFTSEPLKTRRAAVGTLAAERVPGFVPSRCS